MKRNFIAGHYRLPAWWLVLFLMLGACSTPSPKGVTKAAGYAPAASCRGCHAEIAKAYAATGMARSFAAFDPARMTADFTRRNKFYHEASDRHYTMTMRGGAAYLRRHQVDAQGREVNVVEKRIDYVMGSGLKAQTMVHRTPRGELVELPVAWYTSNGGYWAMNPGFDRADHLEFRRRIRYDCFFCHNAYPAGVADDSFVADAVFPAALPAGIDCQRCHGPGAAHVEAAGRAAILNPKKLTRDAQLEVCYQCHLQSTSTALPHVVTKLGRGIFSYRAGEPLAEYALHFDHPPEAGRAEKFEIAHAAYRLRQSACFLKSEMTCTTCHDPHRVQPAGSAACVKCHASPAGAVHAGRTECVTCHMPQRRTEDVVQVAMTDHRIVRRAAPEAERLAMRAERTGPPYRGRVMPYLPAQADALHAAVAQVRVGTNLGEGVPALAKAVEADARCGWECFYELADAYGKLGRADEAAKAAERALQLAPANPWLLRAYGSLLSARGDLERGTQLLKQANLANDPQTLLARARNALRAGQGAEAASLLQAAIALDPDAPELHVALGEAQFAMGRAAEAKQAFAAAVRAQPDHALAHFNLASLDLNAADAEEHLRRAARYAPDDARIRRAYGIWLASRRRAPEALAHLEAAVQAEPSRLDSHLVLGMVLAETGQQARALEHLRRAAASPEAGIRAQAQEVLAAVGAR